MFRPRLSLLLLALSLSFALLGCTKPAANPLPPAENLAPKEGPARKEEPQPQREAAESQQSLEFDTGEQPKIVIELFQGSITISPVKGNKVRLEVTKKAVANSKEAAEAHLKDIQVEGKIEKGVLLITGTQVVNKDVSAELVAVLHVPSRAHLDLKSRQGAIAIAGVTGDITAATSSAAITVKEAKGNLDLATSFANVEVSGDPAKVKARNNNGGIQVVGGEGGVDLGSRAGAILVDGKHSEVIAHTSSGEVTIRNVPGTLDLQTSFAKIDVDAPCRKLIAENSNGGIQVKGAVGPVTLTSRPAGSISRPLRPR